MNPSDRIQEYDYSAKFPHEWKLYVSKKVQAVLDAYWDADAEEEEDLKFYDSDTSERL